MPGNRKQREAVAAALTVGTSLTAASPKIILDVLCAEDWREVLEVLWLHLPDEEAGAVLPSVCRAAGIQVPQEEAPRYV